MKLEVGMYVRTKFGISKIIETGNIKVIKSDNEETYDVDKNGRHYSTQFGDYIWTSDILKASHNIIDLIEVGDIIKFKELRTHLTNESGTKFYDNYVVSIFNEEELKVAKEEIEGKHMKLLSIVTKEQFEAMQYKV